MKNFLTAVFENIVLIGAALIGAVLLVIFWFWFILVVLGVAGLIFVGFVTHQLSGKRIVVRNTKTKEVLGYIENFKYQKAS